MELDQERELMDEKLDWLLQKVYDLEVNLSLSWCWDAGFVIRLGDEINGWKDEEQVERAADIAGAIQRLMAEHYPGMEL